MTPEHDQQGYSDDDTASMPTQINLAGLINDEEDMQQEFDDTPQERIEAAEKLGLPDYLVMNLVDVLDWTEVDTTIFGKFMRLQIWRRHLKSQLNRVVEDLMKPKPVDERKTSLKSREKLRKQLENFLREGETYEAFHPDDVDNPEIADDVDDESHHWVEKDGTIKVLVDPLNRLGPQKLALKLYEDKYKRDWLEEHNHFHLDVDPEDTLTYYGDLDMRPVDEYGGMCIKGYQHTEKEEDRFLSVVDPSERFAIHTNPDKAGGTYRLNPRVRNAIWALHNMNPAKYHPREISRMFGIKLERTNAILKLEAYENRRNIRPFLILDDSSQRALVNSIQDELQLLSGARKAEIKDIKSAERDDQFWKEMYGRLTFKGEIGELKDGVRLEDTTKDKILEQHVTEMLSTKVEEVRKDFAQVLSKLGKSEWNMIDHENEENNRLLDPEEVARSKRRQEANKVSKKDRLALLYKTVLQKSHKPFTKSDMDFPVPVQADLDQLAVDQKIRGDRLDATPEQQTYSQAYGMAMMDQLEEYYNSPYARVKRDSNSFTKMEPIYTDLETYAIWDPPKTSYMPAYGDYRYVSDMEWMEIEDEEEKKQKVFWHKSKVLSRRDSAFYAKSGPYGRDQKKYPEPAKFEVEWEKVPNATKPNQYEPGVLTRNWILTDTSNIKNREFAIMVRDKQGSLREPTAEEFHIIRHKEAHPKYGVFRYVKSEMHNVPAADVAQLKKKKKKNYLKKRPSRYAP